MNALMIYILFHSIRNLPQNYNKIRKQARLYSEFAVKMQ